MLCCSFVVSTSVVFVSILCVNAGIVNSLCSQGGGGVDGWRSFGSNVLQVMRFGMG